MSDWMYDIVKILIALLLVLINGFFVASEFALVKIRRGRLEELVKKRRPFAATARWFASGRDLPPLPRRRRRPGAHPSFCDAPRRRPSMPT